MTAPQHLHTKASTRTSEEDEKLESEGSETVPQHGAPVSSAATTPTSNDAKSSDASWEDEKAESEGSETTEQTAPRRRGFDARAAMIFQNWRQTSGEAGEERKQATGAELSGLRDTKAVTGFDRREQLNQHLLERTGRAGPRRDEGLTSELGKVDEKKSVTGFDRREQLNQHLLERTGRAGPRRDEGLTSELGKVDEKKSVTGFDRREQLNQHLLERTGRAGPRRDEGLTSELGKVDEKKSVTGFDRRERFERHLEERTGRARYGPSGTIAEELQGLRGKGRVGQLKKVLGPEHAFTKAIGERKDRGPDFDPEKHVAEKRRVREEQKEAKGKVEEKLGTLKKEIATARELAGTEHASADLAEYDKLAESKDWIGALAALEHVEAQSKEALSNAEEAAGTLRPLGDRVAKAPACLQPTGWKEARAALGTAYAAKKWLTLGRDVGLYRTMIEQAIGFIDRVAEVRRRTELLKNPTQASNMKQFLEELEKMTWDKVVATQHSTSEKGAIGYLEDRLNRYEGNAAAAEHAIAEAKRKQDEGLIGSNGKEIKEKKLDDFTTEEKGAIENSLNAYDGNSTPVLTHPNGMQWAAAHQNRDGHLPGTAGAGGYKEYYVEKKPGSATYHGNRRLVVHTKKKRVYYSWTHYGDNGSPAFVRIR